MKKELSSKQREELVGALKTRFEKNLNRHKGLEWAKVQARLEANPGKLWSLGEMERTDGEPDVVMACCGDVPTLETLAAVDLIRKHLPELKVRVINIVNLMKLQPQSEHPHGLSDRDFDSIFTVDKPIIFNFHGYPWLIHRLAYRRTNHNNMHVHGYREKGNINTPLDLAIQNQIDRFSLAIDAIDRVPKLQRIGSHAKEEFRNLQIGCRNYAHQNGIDDPEIEAWKWPF